MPQTTDARTTVSAIQKTFWTGEARKLPKKFSTPTASSSLIEPRR